MSKEFRVVMVSLLAVAVIFTVPVVVAEASQENESIGYRLRNLFLDMFNKPEYKNKTLSGKLVDIDEVHVVKFRYASAIFVGGSDTTEGNNYSVVVVEVEDTLHPGSKLDIVESVSQYYYDHLKLKLGADIPVNLNYQVYASGRTYPVSYRINYRDYVLDSK